MTTTTSPSLDLRNRLRRLLDRPQRHRLLHGYPLAAAMPFADDKVRRRAENGDSELCLPINPGDALLVGVLPHPFCNPKISGCGFCTFPHESFSAMKSAAVVQGVIKEIDDRVSRQPELKDEKVAGLYFGGGTANLTPPEPFRCLTRKVGQAFDVSQAEVTLEGVPARFIRGEPLLIDVMQEELPARHFRISMGIQTFSEKRLEQMGRLGFGKPATFASAVKAAHQRAMTTSGDLLFNLPSQTLPEMQEDVRRAIDIGLDQICLYHLVMFRGLGSVWSRDDKLLSALPNNRQAADNWLALREFLIASGYRQTTLTNFERKEFENDPRRYCYEPISFETDRAQAIGFGPAGLSFIRSPEQHHAIKTMNPESSAEYLQAVHGEGVTWNRYFQYDVRDLELFHFTRRLASLRISKTEFTKSFGVQAWEHYTPRFELLVSEGLVNDSPDAFSLTPRGMFFADSIAGFLAESRWDVRSDRRDFDVLNSNARGYM